MCYKKCCYLEPEPVAGTGAGAGQDWTGSTKLAINSINLQKEDGTFYELGEDIPEAPERFMTDTINEPIMLNRYRRTTTTTKWLYYNFSYNSHSMVEAVDLFFSFFNKSVMFV